MTYDRAKDVFLGSPAAAAAPARNWYALTNAMVGTGELPTYGRALEVTATAAVTLVVVPVAQQEDTPTRTIVVPPGGNVIVNRGVRQIVSVNGGNTVPAGVTIDVITE